LFGSLPRELNFIHRDPGRRFAEADAILDRAASGPVWLKDPAVAQSVLDSLQYGERVLRLYELRAWVIMSNHTHLLIDPHADLARINKAIRNFAARTANRLLDRSGPFWQHESYDHWVRSAEEANRILRYIEWNPVKAMLVQNVEQWRWSSAFVA
jgi:putative transposase